MSIPISRQLGDRLRRPGCVLVLTGAGVSAESGLATFRGPGGIWRGHDPTRLATPEAFAADPLLVWQFYAWRREQAAAAEPNPGHHALAAMERSHPDFALVTQNVDGLHERAGSREVVRLHGSLWRLRCVGGCPEYDDPRPDLGPLPPRCGCGGLLRPSVVWFGEPLPAEALARAERAARQARIVIVAGTSSLVYPAAALPLLAREAGAYVIEVNPGTTPLTRSADLHLAGPAGEVLPALVEAAS